MSAADLKTDWRCWPARSGALEATVQLARDSMATAIEILKQSKSPAAREAAKELQFRLTFIDDVLAEKAAADVAWKAERDAKRDANG